MSKINALIEKRDEMEAEIDAYMESDQATVEGGREKQEAIKGIYAEIEQFEALEKSRSEMKAAAKARSEFRTERPFGFSNEKKNDSNSVKSLGQVFAESEGFKNFLRKDSSKFSMSFDEVNLAAVKDAPPVFNRNGLSYPDQERGVNLVGRTSLGFTDLFSQSGTQRDAISFLQQTSLNRSAQPTSETVKKPYATNGFVKNTVPVRKIAVLQKVTDEQLADFQETQAFLNDVLVYDVRKKWDEEGAAGNGTDPHILGVFGYNLPTFAKASGDSVADAIYRGITQVENLGYTVDYVAMNLADWVPIRLSKTNQGVYLFGDPGVDGLNTIFGKKVFTNSAIPVGTALVGNFKAAGTWYSRDGIRIELSNSNVDDFENNLVTLRVESRNALAIKRPDALVKITGLDG